MILKASKKDQEIKIFMSMRVKNRSSAKNTVVIKEKKKMKMQIVVNK